MKAVRIHQYGNIDSAVLEEIPVPKIGLDKVLVQVEAASINPLDVKVMFQTSGYLCCNIHW